MNEKRGWGSTVLGWFVVREGEGAPVDPFAALPDTPVTAEAAGGAAAAPEPPIAFATPPPAAPGGQVDFPAVFAAAGIDAEEQERVAKAAGLLRSLPADTDAAVKKQIVEASLIAFGVPVDQIIENGAQEIQALEGYIQAGARDTQQVLADAQHRIARLEEEIAQVRRVMEERVTEQQAVVRACNERKLDVQQVLEFFGQEAVARVVRASPKLVEPEAGGSRAEGASEPPTGSRS
jgi:hypothetical protein